MQNKWVALGLGFIFCPAAFVYLSKFRIAGIYFVLVILAALTSHYLEPFAEQNPYINLLSPSLWFPLIGAVHAFIYAKRKPLENQSRWYNKWWGALAIVPITIGIIISVRAFLFEPFSMPSASMEPTISVGDFIVVEKLRYGVYAYNGHVFFRASDEHKKLPRRGELFVFNPPHLTTPFMQRVIGVPGDRIQFHNKKLIINDEPVVMEPGINAGEKVEVLNGHKYSVKYVNDNSPFRDGEYVVPSGHYFVMGDNRDNSADSRIWGMVPSQNILGKVVIIFD